MRGIAIALLAVCATMTAAAQQKDWSYEGKQGPLNWAHLDAEWRASGDGKQQSPIDIKGARLSPDAKPIEFHYISSSMVLTNTGHTVEVTPKPGSYIIADGTRYELVEFHFHHPGEETVNGKLSDMSVQFVHKSADGTMAIVAVRLNETTIANVLLAGLWEHLPKTAGATDKMTQFLNPGALLPVDRGYWAYDGSLTEPPCTEGVRWFVMEQMVDISRDQLRAFAALYKVNSRLLQDRHGRKIVASE